MTREQAKQLLPVIQAFAEGKDLQYQRKDGVWVDDIDPSFRPEWPLRIKPEPREWWLAYRYGPNDYICFSDRQSAAIHAGEGRIIHVLEVLS